MKKTLYVIGALLLVIIIIQASGFSILHVIVSQKDMKAREMNSPAFDKKVLIAARSSRFKDAVVDKIFSAFQNDSVHIAATGINDLNRQDPGAYATTVIINTCMAGTMDLKVKNFLKKNSDNESILVFTTSGSGDWLPETNGSRFDAVSSASEQSRIEPVANQIVEKIRFRLNKYNLSF